MDVRDQSKAIDQARDRYREAQEDLRSSYDKNLSQMKQTFDGKIEKQSKTYADHKAKLEENNQINNELYTEKTQTAIGRGQEEFKNRLRENTTKFEKERSESKNDLTTKLADLSESYKKTFDENNRYQDQIKKSMNERYTNANKKYHDDFTTQINNLEEKSTKLNAENRDTDKSERLALGQKNANDLETLRSSSNEDKFKEVSRLKNDTENLRTTMERDNQMLKDRQEERVADLFKLKNKEGIDGRKNFEDLQANLRQKNLDAQEKQNLSHKKDSKELETKFNEDVRNIQSIANQKIKGGTQADNLNDELKNMKASMNGRLQSARDEISRNNQQNTEKEETIDLTYRDKLKEMKTSNIEKMAKKDVEANDTLKKTVYENREKNTALIDRYKAESNSYKKESEDRLSHVSEQNKLKAKDQRVEFGRVVNNLSEKNMETINSLKEDFSKDKTTSIEKSKKESNDEKVALKNEFNRQNAVRETLYEQKLANVEKEASKIIDNYENRISQIARKAENEVEMVKSTENARKLKEDQATKTEIENLRMQNNSEITQMRDKYEGIISKDRSTADQQTTKIVQKYEDQITRERIDHQKEMAVRMSEAQSQFERLYKSSELEKQTLRNQYDQRMANVKAGSQDNSKKS